MSMFSIAQSVTHPLALVAFVSAVAAYVFVIAQRSRDHSAELKGQERHRLELERLRNSRIRFVLIMLLLGLCVCAALVLAWVLARPSG